MKRILFILIPLLTAAGGAGFVYFQRGAEEPAEAPAAEEPAEAYGEFKVLDGLIVNPAGTAGRRHLLISLGLESDDAEALEALEQREIVVRDALIRRLSALTVDELATAVERTALKDSLLADVNAVLGGGIRHLYFTQYVLQ